MAHLWICAAAATAPPLVRTVLVRGGGGLAFSPHNIIAQRRAREAVAGRQRARGGRERDDHSVSKNAKKNILAHCTEACKFIPVCLKIPTLVLPGNLASPCTANFREFKLNSHNLAGLI